jgi:hypothetical protein
MQRQRLWVIAVYLYTIGIAADFAVHLGIDRHTELNSLSPANLAVAFSASLFWPIDLIGLLLFPR